MSSKTGSNGGFSVKAHVGDFKTLLAFNFDNKQAVANLAGFTIQCEPKGQQPYYLINELRFETPGDHAQDSSESANATINAPIQKFRWVHVPGSFHQGIDPTTGPYTYRVTPRYFDKKQSMQALDPSLTATVTVPVGPFAKGAVELGFTRGFVQSQAFVHHFGKNALIRPKGKDLIYDTSAVSGSNAQGEKYTYEQEYEWLGFTARQKIFGILNDVVKDTSLRLDMFAYDLNEPDVVNLLLKLAKQGRVRIILDDASLHHSTSSPKPEDQFEALFNKTAGKNAAILRGKFGRYAHDKVLIVSKGNNAIRVLTGSTNFSPTGLYVNSNHVVVFNDSKVASQYAAVFEESWNDGATEQFENSTLAASAFSYSSKTVPPIEITFSPHQQAYANEILSDIAARVQQEKSTKTYIGNVVFAVMQLTGSQTPVYDALKQIHTDGSIFSYGISDSPDGIFLYSPGSTDGVLVTGKPGKTELPAPFDQVASVSGHQIHHKFVVCGFNGSDPVVYCGSSNLATGGEHENGDNLLAIHDGDIATAFAIEALTLADHFNFLDKYSAKAATAKMPADTHQAAVTAGWFLFTDNQWATRYFDSKDLHYLDREVFA